MAPLSAALALLFVLLQSSPSSADLFEAFESPETSWQLAEADCAAGLAEHRRTFQEKYQGQGSEYVHLQAGTGTYVYLTHAMPEARIIGELSPSVWVKADRPGLQLMLRVVLPRTPVGDEGQVLKTLLRGESYTDVGNWQRLSLENLPLLMSRELALLRTQFGPQVDAREAYVDLVVLNAFGGTGNTRVWLDSLQINGIAQVETGAKRPELPANAAGSPLPGSQENRSATPRGSFAAAELPKRATLPGSMPNNVAAPVELQGDLLTVGGRPRFIRAIEYNGERFEYLQGLGFNAIRLPQPATAAQLSEAQEVGIWLIAPPPLGPPPSASGQQAMLQAHHWVIAWDAGEALSGRDLESVRQRTAQTRLADPLRRPVLTIPRSELAQYSRTSDIVALHAGPYSLVGGDAQLADYRTWVERQRRLLRPGMACWTMLPTELPQAMVEQWKALDSRRQNPENSEPADTWPTALEPQQLHQLAYQALAAGSRGLLFTSRSRLDQADASSGLRATTLQCLNQQLNLLEPWVAGGDLSVELEVHDPTLSVALLKTDRSVLALLTKTAPDSQYVSPPMTPRPVSLVVRGVPASSHAFRVSPLGLNKLRVTRHGGMRLQLESFRHSAAVVITQDPLVINHLHQEIQQGRRLAARSRRELVARQVELTQQALGQANIGPPDTGLQASNLEQAEAYLRRSELLLDSGDERSSVGAAAESLEFLSAVRRDAWQATVRGFPAPHASPACVSFASVPLHWKLTERLKGGQWGGNQLPGGNMEDLGFMQSVGWDQQRTAATDVATLVELTPAAPHGGSYSLRMAAKPIDTASSRLLLEEPAIEVRTAPVRLYEGQLVQIRGWAKVRPSVSANRALADRSLAGRAPLVVYDSFGTEALSQEVIADNTWREFVLYRAATADAPVTVTLSLRGYGEALIDDLVVIPLQGGRVAP